MTEAQENGGVDMDKDAKVHPFVMQQINQLHTRITTNDKMMQSMWARVQPLTKFYDWAKETHPELLHQYASIHELLELGKTNEWEKMARGYGAVPKASGQAVKYEVGNGTL